MNPKITVTVPVYNAAGTLVRCLDSICGQTYDNLEILLIDDGSYDGSGAICDAYAGKDARIRVVHQENTGVSAVRNRALQLATGEWLGFVDDDDWIEPDMYEYLFSGIRRYDADIAICGHWAEFRRRAAFTACAEETVLDTRQALTRLLQNEEIQSLLCDKLWRRTLFQTITFPAGRSFEDVTVAGRLFEQARRVVALPEGKYHYIKHPDSLSSSLTLSNQLNYYLACKQRYEELFPRWPDLEPLLGAQCAAGTTGVWAAYYSASPAERATVHPLLREMSSFARKYGRSVTGLGGMGRLTIRLAVWPAGWSLALARLVGIFSTLKHRLGW